MKKMKSLKSLLFAFFFLTVMQASGAETTAEKVDTKVNEAMDSATEGVHKIQDKTCETINGKMECVGKTMKHKMKDGGNKVKTKAKEIKNKVD